MKIGIVHPGYLRAAAGDLERAGLGRNETSMVLASRLLAARDREVRVFADCGPAEDQGVAAGAVLDEQEYTDVVIFWVRTTRQHRRVPGRDRAAHPRHSPPEEMAQASRDLPAAHDFSQAVLPVWEMPSPGSGSGPGQAVAGLVQPDTPPGRGGEQ